MIAGANRALEKGLQPPAAECASELAARHLPVNGRGSSASAEGAESRLQPRITVTARTKPFQQPARAPGGTAARASDIVTLQFECRSSRWRRRSSESSRR